MDLGAEEKLEEWSPQEEGVESKRGQQKKIEASEMEMAELIPNESESDKENNEWLITGDVTYTDSKYFWSVKRKTKS